MELIPSVRNVVAKSKAVFAVVFALSGCGAGPTEPIIADYSILFIGNSLTYTNDLPQTLERLLSYSDHGEVEVESIAHPNYGLEDHWYRGTAGESITKGNWDVVIMQQGPSATEGRPSLLEYSQRFAELIKLGGATPAMFMIWPSASRRSDMFGVSDSYKTAAELTEGFFFRLAKHGHSYGLGIHRSRSTAATDFTRAKQEVTWRHSSRISNLRIEILASCQPMRRRLICPKKWFDFSRKLLLTQTSFMPVF